MRALIVAGLSAAVGCSAIVDERLQGRKDAADASADQRLRLDAPLPPRLEVSVSPDMVFFDQLFVVTLTAFNFRLVPIDSPTVPGKGYCLLSFVQEGKSAVAMLKASSRTTELRLSDFPMLGTPPPGPHALLAELHLNDGTALGGEARVEVPLFLCSGDQCPREPHP